MADDLANGSTSSDGTSAHVEYVVIGSDAYLLYDPSMSSGFQDGTDVVIKLAGRTTVGTYGHMSGILTF